SFSNMCTPRRSSSWAMRRSTVEWFTPRRSAAARTEPPRATARKWRTSSQSIMVQSRTARCAFQSPYLTHRTAVRAVIIAHTDRHYPIPNGGHQSSRLASVVRPDRFCTTDVRASALNALLRRTYVEVLGGVPERRKTEPEKRSHG